MNFDIEGKKHSKGEQLEHKRKMRHPDPSFEERAKRNSEKVMRTHEFRKENIKEMELGDKDYFEYNPNEPQRYAALNLEHILRFPNTFNAIKWGILVGAMFGFHRYYRTRNVNNAAHWFTVMSFFSFFNIWVSYAIQDFISDYSVRKSISLSQRNEYQQDCYKMYWAEAQKKVDYIDKELKVQPIMRNSQVEALSEFIQNYQIVHQGRVRSFLRSNRNNEYSKLSNEEAKQKLLEVINNAENMIK